MSHAQKIARDEALAEALRALDEAIGDEPPTDQAFRIIAAIKRLREGVPVKVQSLSRIDYLTRVQTAARAEWLTEYDGMLGIGPEHEAIAGIDTPIGRLKAVTWRRTWASQKGERIAWAGEYYLDDEPITIAEIKAAGLAQRPTTRNRQKRSRK